MGFAAIGATGQGGAEEGRDAGRPPAADAPAASDHDDFGGSPAAHRDFGGRDVKQEPSSQRLAGALEGLQSLQGMANGNGAGIVPFGTLPPIGGGPDGQGAVLLSPLGPRPPGSGPLAALLASRQAAAAGTQPEVNASAPAPAPTQD